MCLKINACVRACVRTCVCMMHACVCTCVKDNGNSRADYAHRIQPRVTDGMQPRMTAYRRSAELLCVGQLERNKRV